MRIQERAPITVATIGHQGPPHTATTNTQVLCRVRLRLRSREARPGHAADARIALAEELGVGADDIGVFNEVLGSATNKVL